MKPVIVCGLVYCLGLVAPACAAAPAATDMTEIDQEIASLDTRINEGASKGTLSLQAVDALRGKQQEIENREAKLKAQSKITPDEKSALALSVKSQEALLMKLSHANLRAPKKVDASSLPPTTYVAPNGTTIIAPAGSTGNTGVLLPSNGPVTNPAPAAGAVQPLPAGGAQ